MVENGETVVENCVTQDTLQKVLYSLQILKCLHSIKQMPASDL